MIALYPAHLATNSACSDFSTRSLVWVSSAAFFSMEAVSLSVASLALASASVTRLLRASNCFAMSSVASGVSGSGMCFLLYRVMNASGFAPTSTKSIRFRTIFLMSLGILDLHFRGEALDAEHLVHARLHPLERVALRVQLDADPEARGDGLGDVPAEHELRLFGTHHDAFHDGADCFALVHGAGRAVVEHEIHRGL